MIKSFKSKTEEAVFNGKCPKGFPADLFKVARRKLRLIDAAAKLDDLRVPPGNCLEALFKDRAGQHSIRINDQFRVCFRWTESGAEDVEITDYH
jgi:proteic killer suppression protein